MLSRTQLPEYWCIGASDDTLGYQRCPKGTNSYDANPVEDPCPSGVTGKACSAQHTSRVWLCPRTSDAGKPSCVSDHQCKL